MSFPTYIVLATFNGAVFLVEQLESIIDQTETNWILLARDDGSTDGTLEIVKRYSLKDTRIQIVANDCDIKGSTISNFATLLDVAYMQGARYVFFCDQDDVWEPRKLELMLLSLRQTEGQGRVPSLLHHDLTVVNESLELINDSFIDLMHIKPTNQHNPMRLISRNEVTGCAMACNRELLEIALPISNQAVMHDWWMALCAGYFGHLAFMSDKLVKYRQHSGNTIGAKSFWHGLNPFTNWIAGWKRGDEEFISTLRQARAFKEAMVDHLGKDSDAYAALELYGGLQAASRLQRLKTMRQFGLWRSHWLLNIVLVMRMLLLPRETDI